MFRTSLCYDKPLMKLRWKIGGVARPAGGGNDAKKRQFSHAVCWSFVLDWGYLKKNLRMSEKSCTFAPRNVRFHSLFVKLYDEIKCKHQ